MNIPLLNSLRTAGGEFIPLASLGDDTARIRRELDELAAFGFVFEWHPYRGVAFRGPAERLCPDQIEFELGTGRIGRRVAVWNRVASTNDLAARASASAANDGLVILAEDQSAGRGRRGRRWSAPARSSLLMSVLVFPPAALAATPWLTALGAVAAAEVVSEWTGLDAKIKWPNDVRVDGRKIAGVLVERGAGAVIGIGLNGNIPPRELPDELAETATSLQILRGEPVDRSELARGLIRRLDYWYQMGLRCGADSLNPAWRTRSEHLGEQVQVTTPTLCLRGRLDDFAVGCALVITAAGGVVHRVETRDVLELVPAAGASAARAPDG